MSLLLVDVVLAAFPAALAEVDVDAAAFAQEDAAVEVEDAAAEVAAAGFAVVGSSTFDCDASDNFNSSHSSDSCCFSCASAFSGLVA